MSLSVMEGIASSTAHPAFFPGFQVPMTAVRSSFLHTNTISSTAGTSRSILPKQMEISEASNLRLLLPVLIMKTRETCDPEDDGTSNMDLSYQICKGDRCILKK